MKASETNSPSPVWNFEELLRRVDDDRELLQELAIIFQEECPRHLKSLKEAVSQSNLQTVAAVAHALKGMLANLAGSRAALAASGLEKIARAGDLAAVGEALQVLDQEVSILMPEVEAYLAGVHS